WAHFEYGGLPARHPGKAGAFIGFDNGKAHRVYAGSDFFLMPSRYEPCGLGQMSAMRYGSLPIVRSTGGLKDTVDNYDETTGGGTGFRFNDLTAPAIANSVGWATATWYDRPEHIATLRDRAMRVRFDWGMAAKQHADAYRWAIERRRGG
ncbi:MAG TPA: glycosyltransferase, partial [Planctomycetia bacterium]|nr:glycosyltransferase [Planctomycetia bacterium]